jgi:opacity protein-like surface antigen
MKKFLLTVVILISVNSMVNAQFTKIGGGMGLSSGFPFHQMSWDYNKSGKVTTSFKGIYELSLPIHISPSFTFFYPHIWNDSESKIKVSAIMFDINGHYIFNTLDKFEFYGLAGLDILFAKKREIFTTDTPTIKESDNALGLNLGAGTYMKLSEQINVYGEVKYIFSKYDQFMVNVGVLVNLEKLKKE